MSMCPICKQYLCYVHSVVWICNLHITFVQIFVQVHQLTRKEKKGQSPWMRKFSGRRGWNAGMLFITRQTRPNKRRGKNLGQLNKDLSTSNPWMSKYSTSNTRTNKYLIRPTHGRENAYEFKLVEKTRPAHGQGNAE